jgi:hypothetical protein
MSNLRVKMCILFIFFKQKLDNLEKGILRVTKNYSVIVSARTTELYIVQQEIGRF